jgi:hypothetical protein
MYLVVFFLFQDDEDFQFKKVTVHNVLSSARVVGNCSLEWIHSVKHELWKDFDLSVDDRVDFESFHQLCEKYPDFWIWVLELQPKTFRESRGSRNTRGSVQTSKSNYRALADITHCKFSLVFATLNINFFKSRNKKSNTLKVC